MLLSLKYVDYAFNFNIFFRGENGTGVDGGKADDNLSSARGKFSLLVCSLMNYFLSS